MDDTVKKARYKLTQQIYAEEGYEALLCVDVESRDKKEQLINVYKGANAPRYVACFDALRHCEAFKGMFISSGELNAVFDMTSARPIDEVFFRGADIPWEMRLTFAEELFHKGLEIADYPAEIACAAMLSENLRVFKDEGRLRIRFVIRPLKGANMREAAFLAADQAKKILLRRFSSPREEIRFLDGLDEGVFQSPVALYSYWQAHREAIRKDYEALYAKPSLARALYLVFQNISRRAKRITKRKKR